MDIGILTGQPLSGDGEQQDVELLFFEWLITADRDEMKNIIVGLRSENRKLWVMNEELAKWPEEVDQRGMAGWRRRALLAEMQRDDAFDRLRAQAEKIAELRTRVVLGRKA